MNGTATTDQYAKARQHAEEAFREHELTVLHEDGVYRHLRFARPGTYIYGFDLVTWPGHLAIDGDLSSGLVFCRVHDMVEFFASGPDINPDYWAEKITSRAAREGTEVYSRRLLEWNVQEHLGYEGEQREPGWADAALAAWREHVEWVDLEHEHPAREAVVSFEHDGFCFADSWEWGLKDWDHLFLLVCFAIRRGVAMYRAERGASDTTAEDAIEHHRDVVDHARRGASATEAP